ncbi:MAG: hypothetical protein WKF43_12465 [Acidimicrobiales bacterium]
MSGSVAIATTAPPLLYGLGVGQGERLVIPPWWRWTLSYAATVAVLLLAVQPPLVAGQRSVVTGGLEAVRR